jgi:IS30 family transposase
MLQRRRWCRLTGSEQGEIWDRWRRGESLSEIGRAVDRTSAVVFQVLARRGGLPPPARYRSARALSPLEREEISRGIAEGLSWRRIGQRVGRAASTVCREVRRQGGRQGYRAAAADAAAWDRARRPKPCRLAQLPALRAVVATKLAADWSPEQIAGWLRQTYPRTPTMYVSHETIYRSLFVQSRGVLKKALLAHLRRRRAIRRSKLATAAGQARGQIRDAVSIRERPATVEDRAIPGHWEGDLLAGANQSYVATLVERHSRYVVLVRLRGKDTQHVVRALSTAVRRLPTGLMSSLTWDRGLELAAHQTFTVATNVRVFFCDPHSPWQRGSNENTNGLLRQYFQEGTDLSTFSQRALNRVAQRLNTRPRKTLNFQTPAAKLASTVAMTD